MSVMVVTGSAGLIGAEAVRFFAAEGFDVVGIDNDMRRVFFGAEASTARHRVLEPAQAPLHLGPQTAAPHLALPRGRRRAKVRNNLADAPISEIFSRGFDGVGAKHYDGVDLCLLARNTADCRQDRRRSDCADVELPRSPHIRH